MKEQLLEDGVNVPLTIIPSGVDFEKVHHVGDTTVFREVYRLPKEAPLLIFAGRLGKEKNIYFLLDCLKIVLKKFPETILFIAGDGPERQGLIDRATELGVEKQIRLPGYLSHQDVFTAYAASDIITFASMTETQGLSLIEGLAMGTPAVCVDAFGVKDILDGEKGVFLTDGSIESFSEKILLLLKDKKLYKEKAIEAKQRAQHFLPEEMGKQMVKVYEDAIRKKTSQRRK